MIIDMQSPTGMNSLNPIQIDHQLRHQSES